jgi:hypothetical protein
MQRNMRLREKHHRLFHPWNRLPVEIKQHIITLYFRIMLEMPEAWRGDSEDELGYRPGRYVLRKDLVHFALSSVSMLALVRRSCLHMGCLMLENIERIGEDNKRIRELERPYNDAVQARYTMNLVNICEFFDDEQMLHVSSGAC